jgi:Bacterial type II/III secretion system short domain
MKNRILKTLCIAGAMVLPVIAQQPAAPPAPPVPGTDTPPAAAQAPATNAPPVMPAVPSAPGTNAADAMTSAALPPATNVPDATMPAALSPLTNATDATSPTAMPPATNLPPLSVTPPPVPAMTATNLAMPELPPLKPGELRMNFRNAPIALVLNYMSEAAGFIIELQTPVQGTVDVWSSQPVSKEEAVDLLNSILNKNGYAAVRNGRKLSILSKADALHANIPVKIGNDPDKIPDNDEMITQVIPLRFVEAGQLIKDINPMVSPKATIMGNDDGNAIAVTDTQSNIRHLVEIIKAIDTSAEDSTEIRVFHLKYADAFETANLLTSLFSPQGSSNTSQAPFQFGGGGGGFGRFMASMMMGGGRPSGPPGGGSSAANNQSQRIKKRTQVAAVADPRTSSVIVTATKDLVEQIAQVIEDIDHRSPKETSVQVFHLENADTQEVFPMLQSMFQNNNSGRSMQQMQNQNSPLMQRLQQYQNTSTVPTMNTGGGLGGGALGAGS